ncbi:MAG: protein kinase domain-containing protein, partial [Planctomycetota bacterium]
MTEDANAPETFHCPHCGQGVPVSDPDSPTPCPACGREFVAARLETMPGPGSPPDLGEMPELAPGVEVAGYRLEREIGRGGMGIVFEATQKSLGRKVAVKVLPRKLVGDPEFVARFEREGLALAQLSHPNIVQVIDRGISGEVCFLVMEFVEGVPLRRLLEGEKLPPEQALQIVPQICAALEYAHGRGVVHRDIKPENIMITTEGSVKITDFGLARIVQGESPEALERLTRTNVLMGTPDYMAPEQREKAKEVDHRADIYSLGVIFYEMLTGELPLGRFPAPSKKVEIDVKLDEGVFKALEKEPELRYQRASHMHRDVTEVRTRTGASGAGAAAGAAAGFAAGAAAGGGAEGEGVRVEGGEVRIDKDGKHVYLGPKGIHVKKGGKEVHIDAAGVRVTKDGKDVHVEHRGNVNVQAAAKSCGHAVASLVFAILALLSITCVPLLWPLLAVVFGFVARNKIRESGGRLRGEGMALFGLIAGVGMLVLEALAGVASIFGIGSMISVFSLAHQSNADPQTFANALARLMGQAAMWNGLYLLGKVGVLVTALYVSMTRARGAQSSTPAPPPAGRVSKMAVLALALALLPAIIAAMALVALAIGGCNATVDLPRSISAPGGDGGDGAIVVRNVSSSPET